MTIMSWLKKQNILKIWMYMVIIVAHVFNFPIFFIYLFFQQEINILLLFLVVIINISKFLQ